MHEKKIHQTKHFSNNTLNQLMERTCEYDMKGTNRAKQSSILYFLFKIGVENLLYTSFLVFQNNNETPQVFYYY